MIISKIKKALCLCSLLLVFSLSSYGEIMDSIIVIVNDEVITQGELNSKVVPLYKRLRMQYSGKELEYHMEKVKQQQLDQMINDKLVLSEAKKRGIEVSPKEVNDEIDNLKKKFPSEERFYLELEQQGIRLDELKRKYTENLMAKKLLDTTLGAGISVLPYEVKEYYKENMDKFLTPPQVKVQGIVVRVNDDRSDKMAYNIITGIEYQLKKGADFSEMAYNCSEDSYSDKGGEMGYIRKGYMTKQIDDVLFDLQENKISEVVKTPLGYYIFKVQDKIEAKQKSFYEVHSIIEETLYREKIQKKMENFLKDLREKAYIEYT